MADIISLSKVRKQKARDEKETLAEQNRVKFGRRKTDKNLSKAKKDKQNKDLTDHKVDD